MSQLVCLTSCHVKPGSSGSHVLFSFMLHCFIVACDSVQRYCFASMNYMQFSSTWHQLIVHVYFELIFEMSTHFSAFDGHIFSHVTSKYCLVYRYVYLIVFGLLAIVLFAWYSFRPKRTSLFL